MCWLQLSLAPRVYVCVGRHLCKRAAGGTTAGPCRREVQNLQMVKKKKGERKDKRKATLHASNTSTAHRHNIQYSMCSHIFNKQTNIWKHAQTHVLEIQKDGEITHQRELLI